MSTIVKIWLSLALLLGFCVYVVTADAQTTILLPPPRIQFLDNLGKPLAGGFVFTYLAGTSIQQATYTDSTGATLNPNPVVLDAGGFASIYLTNATSYRIVVQNSLGTQQYVADNLRLVSSAQVGGSNTQVQYNCSGTFCGSSGLTYNSGTQTLSVTSIAVSTGGSLAGTFTGNPIFSGTVTVSGTFSTASLTSTCTPAASSGFVRLCNTDVIQWRNAANSGDYGISAGASDNGFMGFPQGVVLNGLATNPNLKFGGINNTFPMIRRDSGTALRVRLADDSADASIGALNGNFSGNISYNGITISGPCSTGQTLTAASSVSVTCAAASPGVLSHNSTAALVNTAIPNSNTIVFSKAVTMPATGCPCRALASWWMFLSTGNSGQDVAYVSDGLGNAWAAAETATTGAATGYGFQSSGTGPATYANLAAVTFTVVMASSHAAGTTVSGAQLGTAITGAPASQLEIDILGSN